MPSTPLSTHPPRSFTAICLPILTAFLTWILTRNASLAGVTEIRMLRQMSGSGKSVWSGYFGPNDVDALVQMLTPLEDSPRTRLPAGAHPRAGEANIYFSLQPVDPVVVRARGPVPFGRLERANQTSRDRDIGAYSILVVDIDPVRPSSLSATDAEKEQAAQVARNVSQWFEQRGVIPVLADSGNGYHLLVPLKPVLGEKIPEAARAAQHLLRQLDARFSTEGAKVDTSTFNPSRILKLYGTLAVKGPSTEERPHRMSSVDVATFPEEIDLFALLSSVSRTRSAPDWPAWRKAALEQLSLVEVYAEWLTGQRSGDGWLECRDPASPTGDQNPSAGVADGSGEAERGIFHSFRTGESLSVFDFLIRNGRATDFRDACEKVSSWTGVPVVTPLFQGGSGGISSGRVAEEKTDPPYPPLKGGAREEKTRVTLDYVTNVDSIADLFDTLLDAILPLQCFFRSERELVYIRSGVGPIPVTERSLPGLVSARVDLRFLRRVGDEDLFMRFDTLPGHLARAFVHDPRVMQRLPELTSYCRSPMYDGEWRFIGSPGYHPGGVYYDGPEVTPARDADTPMPQLMRALEGFHFKEDADRANFVGILLTALTMPHWGRGHPFLAINGNKPGVGKTTLARVLGVIAEGCEPATVSYVPDDAELEKQLATRLEVGDRVIIIDNAKTRKAIESQVLERCVTDSRPAFRRLGSNSSITRPQNDLLFVLTMNMVQLGPDLRRRALPVNLHIEDNVRGVNFPLEDIVGYVQTHRLALVAELAGMVERWLEQGRPVPRDAARHSTGQKWVATLDGILRVNNMPGFLSNFETSLHEYDPSWELLSDIAQSHRDQPSAYASEWVGRLERTGHTDRFRDRRGEERSARAKATIVGTLFSEYINSEFRLDKRRVRLERHWPEGTEHKPAYQFITVA